MASVLCITIRFLDPVPQFHGRGDTGDPEWPPSPLRLFQAMVSAAASRWRETSSRSTPGLRSNGLNFSNHQSSPPQRTSRVQGLGCTYPTMPVTF
jgi:hypothetical protein